MPASNLLFEDLVDQLMLLDDAKTFKLCRHNIEAVHRAAAARDILNLSHRQHLSEHSCRRTARRCGLSYLKLRGLQLFFQLVENM